MSAFRWLFGRSRLNRLDPVVLVTLALYLPLWLSIPSGLAWIIASVMIETALFGREYHRLSDAYQHIAENFGAAK